MKYFGVAFATAFGWCVGKAFGDICVKRLKERIEKE